MSETKQLVSDRQQCLQRARFYGILDFDYIAPFKAVAVANQMREGGVQILQLRAKKTPVEYLKPIALEVKQALENSGVLFIINDHISLASEIEADGIHIGQDDGSVAAARKQLHPWQLIGKSTHSLEQATATAAEKPDYIAIGPLFATPTKPDYIPVGLDLISQVAKKVSLPQFCIGGINETNLDTVLKAGATRVVMVSAILKSPDIAAYCRSVVKVLIAS